MSIKSYAMKQFTILAVLLAASLGPSADQKNSCPDGPHTLYSKRAVSLDSGLKGLKSPDGSKLLTVRTVQDSKDPDGSHISFTVSVAGKKFSARLLGFNAEVLWAQDSS